MTDDDFAERDAAGVRLLADAYTRWADAPPVTLKMTRQDAWTVMMALQKVVAHPDLAGGPLARCWENVGRHIQEAVADSPELYAVAECGWHRAYDVDSTSDPRRTS
ncbi:hypothetical protein ACIQU6_30605 [Streptomyces sp. NPDC090442]|uniref:hypothetical protein n=1 Tax=Streptomyces sp. NPDC090442 TaxID=3365962 RepID=UPI00380FA3EB